MHNKRFLFLVAWVDGADGGETGIHQQSDLLKYPDNEDILCVEVFAPNADVADAIGWRYAISDDGGNYTLSDTVSMVIEISEQDKLLDSDGDPLNIPTRRVSPTGIDEVDVF